MPIPNKTQTMKKVIIKSIFSTLLICLSIQLLGQTIDWEKKSKEEVVQFEKLQDSNLVDSIASYGILKNPHIDLETLTSTKVLIFKRGDDGFNPPLHVWYHFDKESEELKGVNYYWGLYNPSFNSSKNKPLLKKLTKKEKDFKRKYKELEKELNAKWGTPIKNKKIADNNVKYVENIFWEDDEKIVKLAIKFFRKLVDRPRIGILADFKIEVMVTYK